MWLGYRRLWKKRSRGSGRDGAIEALEETEPWLWERRSDLRYRRGGEAIEALEETEPWLWERRSDLRYRRGGEVMRLWKKRSRGSGRDGAIYDIGAAER